MQLECKVTIRMTKVCQASVCCQHGFDKLKLQMTANPDISMANINDDPRSLEAKGIGQLIWQPIEKQEGCQQHCTALL